ncbi:GtrA family protein [Neobacillus novalis]|uniref:GtrA family protein n=1 Tax=Neobacillus novalis TaxID=220687 RepID=A0AA95SAI4_9BACI|nr:GtrA family protein [Neobacillus novalis]WHY85439.1 GtrA family protein [Neobacillus novalis]
MNNKKEAISYLFFGVLTTVINIVCYAILTKIMNMDYKLATTFSWILAVIFAFITNKLYVFKSNKTNLLLVVREFTVFTFFRLLSYFLDILTMIVCVEYLTIDDFIAKIAANILVIVFNYFASKYVVFKKMKS